MQHGGGPIQLDRCRIVGAISRGYKGHVRCQDIAIAYSFLRSEPPPRLIRMSVSTSLRPCSALAHSSRTIPPTSFRLWPLSRVLPGALTVHLCVALGTALAVAPHHGHCAARRRHGRRIGLIALAPCARALYFRSLGKAASQAGRRSPAHRHGAVVPGTEERSGESMAHLQRSFHRVYFWYAPTRPGLCPAMI